SMVLKVANPNPVKARMAQRAKDRKTRKGMTLADVRVIMSDFIEALDSYVSTEEERPSLESLKGVGYLLNQAIGSYVKLVEIGELEARAADMQRQIDDLKASTRDSRLAA